MDLETTIAQTSVNLLIGAVILLIVLAGISLHEKHLTERLKKILFSAIIFVIAVPTLYMIVSTIYLNAISRSSGPVHWHADIEVWNCGREVNLLDPKGLSNKIGTPTLHEHNDKRIHLEGVVLKENDASLGKFFTVIGGSLSETAMVVPTNDGPITQQNGNVCPDGQPGEVQTFVYKIQPDGTFKQQKLAMPQNYEISPESNVPNGDCVIVEFGQPKDRTDRLCRSYKVAEQTGKLKGEIK